MTAPADAMRCPICFKLECDRHSPHQQQEALRGVQLCEGMEGTMDMQVVRVVDMPKRIRGKLSVRG